VNGLGDILVPAGYVSGHPLSDTATYDNQTLSSLGVTPGTYTWTWGDPDSFTADIGTVSPVPEPTTLWLMASGMLGLAGLISVQRRQKRTAI
jgi:hypothetical protein